LTLKNTMLRVPYLFITPRRNETKSYWISLNLACGVSEKICRQ
jgi:hypothetical protein